MRADLLNNYPEIAIAFDCETWLIQPKRTAPPLVCASAATKDSSSLLDKTQARKVFREVLKEGSIVVGANIAFDVAVMVADAWESERVDLMPAVFAKYNRGEVFDVLIAERLDAIAGGYLNKDPRTGGPLRKRYSLEMVTELVLGRTNAKENDFWRLRYAMLQDVPIVDWPEEARQYPIDDAVNTWEVGAAQCGHLKRDDGTLSAAMNLHAMADIARAAWVLHLGACRGFATNAAKVEALAKQTEEAIEAGRKRFEELGLIRADGSKDTAKMKRLVVEAYGPEAGACGNCGGECKVLSETSGRPINCKACNGTGKDLDSAPGIPRTEKGGVMTARDVLVDSGNEDLADFGEWGEQDKVLTTYVPALRDGLPLRPNVPLANERVSYGGIVQVMPRGGGVRECVEARPGHLLSSVDLAGIEMVTWAQTCINLLGYSTLADAINNGADAHSILGADLCGITYEEFLSLRAAGDKQINNYRQAAKAGNFTFAGGGGEVAFVLAKRKEPGMVTFAPDGKVYKGTRFCILVGGRERCGETMITEYKRRPTPAPVCAHCVEAAARIRQTWRGRWTEANDYFNLINEVVESKGAIVHFASDVIRGGVDFCQAANGYFSALAAVGSKRAYYEVQRECYVVPDSPLYRSCAIGFIHDEIVSEHPEESAGLAAQRVADIMIEELSAVCPDVLVKAEPALMSSLYKGAEPVYDKSGNLIPWSPS